MGGLIKYVTIDPALNRRSARIEIGTNGVTNGSGPGYNVRASANVPLSTTFALRLSGFTRQDPGYVDNPVLGVKGVNETESAGGMVGALWQPRATVSLKLKGLYQHTRGDGLPDVDVRPGLGDLQQAPLPVPDIGRNERTVQAYSAVLATRLWRGELTAITGYNANDWSDQIDGSGALGALSQRFFGVGGTLLDDDFDFRKVSQEIRWSAPIGRKVEWLSGAFYTHEQHLYNQTNTAIDPFTGEALGLVYRTIDLEQTYSEYATFADVTYHFTDRVDVQIGGRLGHNTSATASGVNSGPQVGGVVSAQPLESDETFFSYLVTPRFRVTPNVMLYARLASGYRPGGPNPWLSVQQGAPASFGSDRMRNYEVGIKGGFFDERLSLDASFYYIDWQDVQIRLNASGGYGTNGSGAKSEGFELAGRLTPLRDLTIDAWIAYSNAVLTESFPTASPVLGVAGDRLPFNSPYSGNISLTKELPLTPELTAFVGGSVSYVDDRVSNFQPAGRPRQEFPSYSKADLRGGVRRGTWTVSLFVNNVTDERGVLNEDHYMPLRFTFIQPRTAGFSLSRSF
jgi:outer membrane receptor protein involved in Fe transport